MTLPDERYRAVLAAEQFLLDLCSSKKTPRIPKEIRQRAGGILRHFPSKSNMQTAAEAAPTVFAERMEQLHRWVVLGNKPLDQDQEV